MDSFHPPAYGKNGDPVGEPTGRDPASPQFILTRRGLGYLFHGEEQ
ncbi:hypothetical protein I4200191B4_28310 [Pseudoflavonifractor gallinarum]